MAGILKSAAVIDGAKARVDQYTQADQNCGSDESTDGAEVVDPLADAEAENVEQGEQCQQSKRHDERERLAIGQSCMAGTENKNRDTDEVEHDRRHIEHVVGPVTPAGKESVEVAEDLFGPEIDSAFAGIAVG